MKNLIICLLSLLFPLSVSAVKLNQRGEKMVSEIRVEYVETDAFYTIKFGYDRMGEINAFIYDCEGAGRVIVKSKRDEMGKIFREDYYDGVLSNKYTFKIDSQKRPTEMVWFEKNIHGKFDKTYTFFFEYNFYGYDLSILAIADGDEWAASRDLVKIEDGNAYTYGNVVNLKTKGESKPKRHDKRLVYSDVPNDLNIDLYQLFNGYCRVGISVMDNLGSNFSSLVRWIPIWSKYLPLTIEKYKLNYIYDDGNISKVEVIGFFTDEKLYEISLSYVK